MTTPDISSLASSADLFASGSYSLPQIRSAHRALLAAVDDKAARLRMQVGGSYRELLGTAEAIVRMRGDMESVYTMLDHMCGRCGRDHVAAKVQALGQYMSATEDEEGLGRAARARLLDACVLVLARSLRGDGPGSKCSKGGKGDRLLLAAKVHVLGRLLAKSLDGNETELVGAARKRLQRLRPRLLAAVDKLLQKRNESVPLAELLQALRAYSLVEGDGARAVLRHFLLVRGSRMVMVLEGDEDGVAHGQKGVLTCLRLYTRSLRDVQSLLPNKLTDALLGLKTDALLADPSLRSIEGLRLDLYEGWCEDAIRYYKPFLSHDHLSSSQAMDMLMDWAKKGSNILLDGLGQTLAGMTDFASIVELRTSVLKLWISEGAKAGSLDPSIMLYQIRSAIRGRMLTMLEDKVNELGLVGSEVSATLHSWRQGITDQHVSLWDDPSLDTPLSHGAAPFVRDVVARLYGRNESVSQAVRCYRTWHRVIDHVRHLVAQLRRQRWDSDSAEIEDEETIEERQRLLSEDDSQTLHRHMDACLVEAFRSLEDQLTSSWQVHRGKMNRGAMSRYLLRILRDVRASLPGLEAVDKFGLSMVPSLHEVLVETVMTSSLSEFTSMTLARKSAIGRSLWEGEPALPASPSPGVFRFLRNLSVSMGEAGGDLWSPAAVALLRKILSEQLAEAWQAAVQALPAEPERAEPEKDGEDGEDGTDSKDGSAAHDGKEENGQGQVPCPKETWPPRAGTVPARKRHKDLFVQWFFDIGYLERPLRGRALQDLKEGVVRTAAGLEDEATRQRVDKASQEYWNKTSLLFGLLT